jgi:hypothetical protein
LYIHNGKKKKKIEGKDAYYVVVLLVQMLGKDKKRLIIKNGKKRTYKTFWKIYYYDVKVSV